MRRIGYVGVGVAVLAASVWALPQVKFGAADPLSAVIALVGLLIAIIALIGDKGRPLDVATLTELLANRVRANEDLALEQFLGNRRRTIDVQFDFRQALAHDASGAARRGRLSEVADYHKRLHPRRLVITGAPGAGKTVMAVELMMALLEDRAPHDPVPVRLSASSLDLGADALQPGAATKQVEKWLVTHVVKVHRFSQRSAQALVDAGRVMPVVDGLDELDATDRPGYASRAGQALQLLNGYQRYRSMAELVVTCRTEQYQALTDDRTWIEDAARVEIRRVSEAQAREFIIARSVDRERWKQVLDTVKRDAGGPLALGLNTPWRLTLAVTVYEQRGPAGFLRDPDDLTAAELDTADAVRDHLLSLFIPAALQNAGQSYDPAQVHRWLAVLASYLNHNAASGRVVGGQQLSGTDIVLHDLWPLVGYRQARIAASALVAAVQLIVFCVALTQIPPSSSWEDYMVFVPIAAGACLTGYASYTFLHSTPLWPDLNQVHPYRQKAALGYAFIFLLFGGIFSLISVASGIPEMVITPLLLGSAGSSVVLVVGFNANYWIQSPLLIVRRDLTGVIAIGLITTITIGMPFWIEYGISAGLSIGATCGVYVASLSTVARRYFALLLCTRSGKYRLPWRLGHFLDACYRAGLVRIAGIGYQFRHRELQDYLANHPRP